MSVKDTTFSGSNGSAWPALSNGDTWGATDGWTSPTPLAVNIESGVTPTRTVDGSGYGKIAATMNLSPFLTMYGTPAPDFSTTTNATTGVYTFGPAYPETASATATNVLFIQTSGTVSHYHQIGACTSAWAGLTYTFIDRLEFISGAVYNCMSVFVVNGPVISGAGNVSVNMMTAQTGGSAVTTCTGATFYPYRLSGIDSSSNGANVFRTANTTKATGATGQPSVTLTSNIDKYANIVVGFVGHAQNNVATTTSTATIQRGGATGYATPAIGTAVYQLIPGATTATRPTTKTITAAFPLATTPWGVMALEIIDAGAASSGIDTYVDTSATNNYYRIASNSAQAATKSQVTTATGSGGVYGPFPGLITRYVTSGATKSWITAIPSASLVKGGQSASLTKTVDNGTTTTVTGLTSLDAVNTQNLIIRSVRVRTLASGDLWVSAKFWSGTEPAWPSSYLDGNSTDGPNVAPYTAATYVVLNTTVLSSDLLATAGVGRAGLLYSYSFFNVTGTDGSVFRTADGAGQTAWSYFSDSDWIETTSATLSGAGTLSASATVITPAIVLADSAITGSGTLTSSAVSFALANASITGNGTVSSSASLIELAQASITGQGALSASATSFHVVLAGAALSGTGSISSNALAVALVSASLSGVGSLTATGNTLNLYTVSATITGQGVVTGSALITALAQSSLIGQGLLSASPSIVYGLSATITGTGTLTADGVVLVSDPLQVRETFTRKIGTGLANTSGANLSAATTIKIGTGEVSVGALVPAGTSSTKVGSGLTYTIIKEN